MRVATSLMTTLVWVVALVFFLFSFRACLYGGGGPQAGEVTCLEAWGNPPVHITLILIWSRLHDRWGDPPLVTSPIWGPPPPCKQALLCHGCLVRFVIMLIIHPSFAIGLEKLPAWERKDHSFVTPKHYFKRCYVSGSFQKPLMQSISKSSLSLPINLPSHEGVFRGARVSSLPTNLINFKSLLLPILNFSYSWFLFSVFSDWRFSLRISYFFVMIHVRD